MQGVALLQARQRLCRIGRRSSNLLAIAILAFALEGCAATGFNGDLAAIKSIAIEPVQNPVHIGLAAGDFGTALNPGAGAALVAQSAKDEALTVSLSSQNLHLGDNLTDAVEAAIKRDGFAASLAYTDAVKSADAILSLQIAEVTYERRVWGAIGPHFVVFATLNERATGKRVFHRIYRYDMHTFSMEPTMGLTPDDKYGFETSQDVLAHPDIVVAAFKAGIAMIAADIEKSFKKV
jgi:hypothetical protein